MCLFEVLYNYDIDNIVISDTSVTSHSDSYVSSNILSFKQYYPKVHSQCLFCICPIQIDPEDLMRKSAVLACRRFRGTHSYDKVAEMLDDIHSEVGISCRKVIATVTDNGSNFVKAFRVFNVHLPAEQEEVEQVEDEATPRPSQDNELEQVCQDTETNDHEDEMTFHSPVATIDSDNG